MTNHSGTKLDLLKETGKYKMSIEFTKDECLNSCIIIYEQIGKFVRGLEQKKVTVSIKMYKSHMGDFKGYIEDDKFNEARKYFTKISLDKYRRNILYIREKYNMNTIVSDESEYKQFIENMTKYVDQNKFT